MLEFNPMGEPGVGGYEANHLMWGKEKVPRKLVLEALIMEVGRVFMLTYWTNYLAPTAFDTNFKLDNS
jgi:hypothetical protein